MDSLKQNNDDKVSDHLAQLSNATKPLSDSGSLTQAEMYARNPNNIYGIEGGNRSMQNSNQFWLSTLSPAPDGSLQTKEALVSAPGSSHQTGQNNSGLHPGFNTGASVGYFLLAPGPSQLNNMLSTSGLAPGRPYDYGAPLSQGMMIGHPGPEVMRPPQTMSMYHGIMSPFEFVQSQHHMMHPGSHYHPMNDPYNGSQSNSHGSLPLPNAGYTRRPMQPPPLSLNVTATPVPGQWNYPSGHSKSALPKRAPPVKPVSRAFSGGGGTVKAARKVNTTLAPRKVGPNGRPPASTKPKVFGDDCRPIDCRPINALYLNLPPISEETRAKQEAIKNAARQAVQISGKKEWIASLAGDIAANATGHENPNNMDLASSSKAPAAQQSQQETGIKQDIRKRRTPYNPPDVQVTKEHIRKAIPKEASAIFHILDRRVNFDAHEEDATMYSLLRSWVQDDPFRYVPPAGSNLLEYISLSSQRRVDYVDEKDYDNIKTEEIRCNQHKAANSMIERGPVDVFTKLRSIQQKPSMDALRASQVIQGGKRRNQQRSGLKKRRRQVVNSLKRLGIDLDDIIAARVQE